MKRFLVASLIWLCFEIPATVQAQNPAVDFDTIKLTKTDPQTEFYTFADSLLQNARIQSSAPVQMKEAQFKPGGDIVRGAITIITGIGIGNSQPVDWYLPAGIRTNNPRLDWITDWYCPGYIEKERTRVTNSDGSKSVETEYYNVFSWERGALGYIIEQGDTIGWHYVSMFPRSDSGFISMREIAYKEQSWLKPAKQPEFALWGQFTGIDSYLIYNADENQVYIFRQHEFVAIYHDSKPPQMVLFKRKKPYVQPYLLVSRELSVQERADIIRLALLSKHMKLMITGN